MSTPYEQITARGLIVPDTADILDEVQAEWRAVFGEDLVTTNDTPQGVMIVAEATARSAVVATNAAVANQINPDLAGGVFLDAICALLGLQRSPMTYTVIPDVVLTGEPGTVVPAGIQARTIAGDEFYSGGSVILTDGSAIVDFISFVGGPVPGTTGTLTELIDMVPGLETINNPGAAVVLGTLEQSDASLRELRRVTLALQSISTVEAQVSDLMATEGVRSLQFRENTAATTQNIDGISMVAHSVWACVDGGTDLDVATSLLENKTDGAAWNGAVTVNVVEPSSGQTYPVKFARPVGVPVMIQATVRRGSSTADLVPAVTAAILAYANGDLPNEQSLGVGQSVSPFDIAGAITSQVTGIYVVRVRVAPQSTGIYQDTELAIAINQKATTANGLISVVMA